MATCARCHEQNPAHASFCLACGASLDSPVTEERKVVTVLFADLVGFTSRSERLDPEDVRGLLAPYHARLRAELERFGGTVEKFIGDAVMAVFGAPAVHEDDPERAVRAALAIRDVAVEEGVLQLRIGVTTGEALVAVGVRPEAGEGMVAGDVVNTAARLQAAAPVNGVLVDEATFRATQQAVRYREHRPVAAKGKAAPVAAWQALEPRPASGVDLRRPERAPLVGRDPDLTAVVDALAHTRTTRQPALVTVVGVPGIGKSRLVREFIKRVDGGEAPVTWRVGRSLPYGDGISFWALSEMVKAQAGILETDPPETADSKLEAAVAALGVDDAHWVRRHVRPLVGLGSSQPHGGDAGRSEAFAAWRRFFEALAEHRPTVLVFEDLHWADDGLLDFVGHLVDWAVDVPLLVVCTTRPELFARRAEWGAGRAHATTIALGPLSNEESTRLVDALSDGAALRPDLLGALLENAGGNPLYAEEYVQLASERGAVGGTPLPVTVHGIIAARLDTLDGLGKRVLQDAAVLGRTFWTGGVATVTDAEPWSVEEVLQRLERREFVRRHRRSAVAGETQYAFRHVLVRDVAYAQIPRALRGEKHRRAAEWIESLSAERLAERSEMVAHHYRAALEFATVTRQDTEELGERTRRALRDAGARAGALNAWPAAARFFGEALELWPEEDGRPQVWFEHARAVFRATGTGQELLEEALTALLEADEFLLAADAELLLGELAVRDGRRDEALGRFRRALALSGDDPAARARVLSTLSRFHTVALETDEAIHYGRLALELAEELGLDEVRAHALDNIGFARVSAGDPGGIEDLERSAEIAVEINSPEAVRALLNLGTSLADRGELARMFEVHQRARTAVERLGDAAARQWVTAERVWEHYWRGDWTEAERLVDDLLAAVEAGAPRSHFEPAARLGRGWIALARGHLDEALHDATVLADFVREANYVQALFPALALRTHVLAASQRHDEAWQQARELLDLWRESGINAVSYWTADLAFALSLLGRNDELLQPLAGAPRTRWTEAAQAIAARDPVLAAEMYGRIGSVPDEAFARLLAADWLLARARHDEARVALDEALAFHRRVGAARHVEEAEALLAIAV